MAEAKTAKKPRRSRKKPEASPRSRGIAAEALGSGTPPGAVTRLAEAIEAEGGAVLAPYRDPLGGSWQILAGLPLDRVEPTPYQRDLSEAPGDEIRGVGPPTARREAVPPLGHEAQREKIKRTFLRHAIVDALQLIAELLLHPVPQDEARCEKGERRADA